jgi:hypothetical protein
MLHRLVGDGKLSQVVANHLWLDLNLVEGLAIVHSNHTSDHLRDNDHVAQMCPYWLWLLTCRSLPFCFAELLDQGHGLALQTPLKPITKTHKKMQTKIISQPK